MAYQWVLWTRFSRGKHVHRVYDNSNNNNNNNKLLQRSVGSVERGHTSLLWLLYEPYISYCANGALMEWSRLQRSSTHTHTHKCISQTDFAGVARTMISRESLGRCTYTHRLSHTHTHVTCGRSSSTSLSSRVRYDSFFFFFVRL